MSATCFEARNPRYVRHHGPQLRLAGMREILVAWRRRAQARRNLLAADDRMLADLGISRAEANFKAVSSPVD